ncbi:MAG: hypothetical protein R2865_01835 [Deinococcales bacterium]
MIQGLARPKYNCTLVSKILKPTPKLKTLTYAEALFEAMIHRF